MPPVSVAIAAFVETAAGILRRRADSRLAVSGIADAVRPGVVALYGDAFTPPALYGKQQTVIVLCSVIGHILDITVVLPLLLICQIQRAPLVEIGKRGGWSQVNGGIVFGVTQ